MLSNLFGGPPVRGSNDEKIAYIKQGTSISDVMERIEAVRIFKPESIPVLKRRFKQVEEMASHANHPLTLGDVKSALQLKDQPWIAEAIFNTLPRPAGQTATPFDQEKTMMFGPGDVSPHQVDHEKTMMFGGDQRPAVATHPLESKKSEPGRLVRCTNNALLALASMVESGNEGSAEARQIAIYLRKCAENLPT